MAPVSDPPTGAAAAQEAALEVRIDSLGSEGDGVARGRSDPLHVRYALAGETVLARTIGRNRATAERILHPSAHRRMPPCALFGRCGGCVTQHLDPAASLDWKTARVAAALRGAGFEIPGGSRAVQSPPRTRRRMDLAVRRGPDGVAIGLHVRGSDQVIALSECHVLHPTLFALTRALQPVLTRLQALRRTGSANVNLFDSGPDILLSTDGPLAPRDRTILADFAAAAGIPRIAWTLEGDRSPPEIVCGLAPVSHRLGEATISPPPGAFLQATPEGEAAIVEAVLAGLPDRPARSARAVELYAGCGTISFPVSERLRVSAYEGHAVAVACLRSAAVGRRIEVGHRDLNRQPVMAGEMAGAAAVILDPPHMGAGAQMREIAASLAPRILYVSCNPAALAQDGRLLADAGYRLERLTVMDQFLWSAQAESVCLFGRPAVTRRGPMPRPPR